MKSRSDFLPVCPASLREHEHIQMAHGGGGKLMHRLLAEIFLPEFGSHPHQQHDSAVLPQLQGRLAFTTDSYVVQPVIFPGGDIGSMSVYGTVNDLAMSGSKPVYLSAGFIIEEGFPIATLKKIVRSMKNAAARCGVNIVTGDTKVIERRRGDGLFINTAGIGVIEHDLSIAPGSVQPGDVILLNGDIGRHGTAIMSVRDGLQFDSQIESDSAPLSPVVSQLLQSGVEIHCLRDLTRGGLSATLNEIALAAGLRIELIESSIPVRDDVRAACELMGLDPLLVACEGRFAAFVPPHHKQRALDIMAQCSDPTTQPVEIGSVTARTNPIVVLRNDLGSKRILDMPTGEQLPRIC